MTASPTSTETVEQIKQQTTTKLRQEVLQAYPSIQQEDYFLLGYFLFFMG